MPRPRINLLPGPGARASMSRSRSRGSSGGRSLHARSNGETEEEEEEFEEEEEEDFEDDESEGEGARKRRRKDISAGSGSESNSEGSQKRLSKAQVEERLDRLLNQLKQTERIGNNGASPSDPVLSQPEVQPKIGDEDLPSLKADGQDADFSAQDLGKDEKALELTNGGSHDQDIPGDCQQMQVDRQEMPTEYQGKTDCEHGMPADHEEMPASQQEKVADHHEILVQEQEKATDLQEMPSEHAIETEGSQDNPPICIEMDRSMQNRVDTNDAKDVSIKNPDELDGNQNQMIANDNTLL